MLFSRRKFLQKTNLLFAAGRCAHPTQPGAIYAHTKKQNRLVLLGTQGGPFLRSYKQTPASNLVVYNDVPLVIDAGYGVSLKLLEAGIHLSTLKYIFITHHHSDHNLELGTLLYNAWIAGLAEPVHVFAPVGVKALLQAYWESNRFDITTRIADEGRPDIRKLVVPHEVSEGELLTTDGIEVSALKNIHPPIEESYAFRFKLDRLIIVFSGDTAYCPALGTFASGADFLIHEVMYVPGVENLMKRRKGAGETLMKSIIAHHTSTGDVGRIAKQANVKNLVLNHFVPPDDNTISDEVWISAVKETFDGHIILAKDLLEIAL